jgi:hypothetical protein
MSLSQGPNSPSAATTAAAGGVFDWANPTNAEAADGSYATAGDGAGTGRTYRLLLTGFGFTLPANSAIDGVVVEIKKQAATANIQDNSVKLLDTTGTPYGADRADTVTDWPAVAAYVSHGGSTDTWGGGGTLTAATVNNAGSGVMVLAQINSIGFANVDHVRMTVYYTPPFGLPCFVTRAAGVVHPGFYDE